MSMEAARTAAPTIRRPPTGWARVAWAVRTFGDLFYIQFAAIRTGWQWFFLVSSAIPLGILGFLKFVAPHAGAATVLYFVTGNVVVALMLNSFSMLAGQLAWARQSKTFDFYAVLPVSRTALILASIAIAALFALPGMLILLVSGALLFHLVFHPTPLAVVVFLLSPTALAGLGALVGVLAPNQQVANVMTNLGLVVVMFLSPVLAPASALPSLLQVTSRFLPPTYAADALRHTLTGSVSICWS